VKGDRASSRQATAHRPKPQPNKFVVALKETMQLMEEIDKLIPSFPIE